ncbi:MAG: hypothetical protein JW787_12205 [Sedimentisphaerales bacterium]|nr:hypothetical protein [Sedimentisphaerales bacterium]
MENEPSIITVGLAPAWDITCIGRNIEWGKHQNIDQQSILPAGKALNISRALSWIGQPSKAAGLWGADDFDKMLSFSRASWPLITIEMTVVHGETRKNITIVDTAQKREMHLRNKTEFISSKVLRQLKSDLGKIVKMGNICVFAGAMPEGEKLGIVLDIMKSCHNAGAKIVLDTSGHALKTIIETGLVWLIKPNVSELCKLFNIENEDNPAFLIENGKKLLSKAENILISRGKNGAIFLNNQGIWQSKAIENRDIIGTVGCGDYLLAGFLKGWNDTKREDCALSTAIKLATAKAWGWTQDTFKPEVMEQVQIKISRSK